MFHRPCICYISPPTNLSISLQNQPLIPMHSSVHSWIELTRFHRHLRPYQLGAWTRTQKLWGLPGLKIGSVKHVVYKSSAILMRHIASHCLTVQWCNVIGAPLRNCSWRSHKPEKNNTLQTCNAILHNGAMGLSFSIDEIDRTLLEKCKIGQGKCSIANMYHLLKCRINHCKTSGLYGMSWRLLWTPLGTSIFQEADTI